MLATGPDRLAEDYTLSVEERALTLRREEFAVAYVCCGGNASEAYRRVYPRSREWEGQSVAVNASKMLADTKVQLRVRELRERVTEVAVVDAATVQMALWANHVAAVGAGQLRASNEALKLLGMDLGMFRGNAEARDRREAEPDLDGLSVEQLRRLVELLRGEKQGATG